MLINALNKYWPKYSSGKEVLFIQETNDLFNNISLKALLQLDLQKLFLNLSSAISSHHFQVAEQSMLILNNEKIQVLILEPEKPRKQLFGSE